MQCGCQQNEVTLLLYPCTEHAAWRDEQLAEDRRRRACVPIPDPTKPIPMRLTCPKCGELHIDEGEFATKPHHTHACQSCGMVWRPAIVDTVGVRFLPGFKNGT